MNAEKIFTFEDDIFQLIVKIPEVVDPQYGMFTWPSAPVLAQYLFVNRALFQGKTVIELGAGTALPGIVASLCGCNVILTDKEEYPECLANCLKSCHANQLFSVQVAGITWGQFSPNFFSLPDADIILGSDCFYDPKDFDDILATASFLINKTPSARFLTTYQERSSNWSIQSLLSKWDLQCVHIPLKSFDAAGDLVGGHSMSSKHTIQMLQITKSGYTVDD
ncbi:hypothetical protein QZH41_011682 [Actinostola sp. cb2023]|nr:hypothetical protein QZH41_011682 [Actinostola sp. cb2023]